MAVVAYGIYFNITVMYSMLLCLRVEHSASGSEEVGSQLMGNIENIVCCVLFVHSWVQGTSWIGCDVSVGHQVLYKSKF
jgi:hypothetical protein